MPRVGFEPTISAGERPKTHALDRAATGIGKGGSEGVNCDRGRMRHEQTQVSACWWSFFSEVRNSATALLSSDQL